jgi:hypothetical protein
MPIDRPIGVGVSPWKIGFAPSIWEHVGLLWKICIGQFYTRGFPCQYNLYICVLLLSYTYRQYEVVDCMYFALNTFFHII